MYGGVFYIILYIAEESICRPLKFSRLSMKKWKKSIRSAKKAIHYCEYKLVSKEPRSIQIKKNVCLSFLLCLF